MLVLSKILDTSILLKGIFVFFLSDKKVFKQTSYSDKQEFIYLCYHKIMTIQRAHTSLNLCDRPVAKGSFGYEWIISYEAKCACFENYLL